MPTIRTNAAAAMLGVSPNTLRSWERRFGFPEPRRTAGGHRQFELAEVEALRSAFEQTHNVSSAISLARERGAGPATPERLRAAFARFDAGEADRVVEESLVIRSIERTVEEVMLPGVASLADHEPGQTGESPEYCFAWRWASGWLAAQQRLAPAPTRRDGVLVLDASGRTDLDGLHVQALELALSRGGLRTLTLTVGLDPSRLTHALQALEPRVVVLAGRDASLDVLSRLVYATRRRGAGGEMIVLDFCGALTRADGSVASTVESLPDRPLAARDAILARVDRRELPVARLVVAG